MLAGGSIRTEAIAPTFLLSLVGSIVAGPALAWLTARVTSRIDDAPSSIIVQFVSTYGVWIVAERLGLSPILTVVSYAVTLARLISAYLPARLRIPSYAVWETAVLVLNVLAFLLIGLELRPIIAAAGPGELRRWAEIGLAVLATAITVRLLWTLTAALWAQWRVARSDAAAPLGGPLPSWRTGLIVGWAGTRGIVTVATALALPQTFPERGMLLFAAFSVTLSTLLIQGLTLRPLVLALDVHDDNPIDREVREARVATAGAALAALGEEAGEGAATPSAELEAERLAAEKAHEGDGRCSKFPVKLLRARAVTARRERLLALRRDGAIGDKAFHRLEEDLDLADLALATRT